MSDITNYYNKVLTGDCIQIMTELPKASCNVIFADPPYNLQLNKKLYRPNNTEVVGVNESWDNFTSFKEYDEFTIKWLAQAQRLLKNTGTIWVMGSYHNIFRIGKIMQDMGFWILNQITWIKNNPMPNFKGVRFTNSQETIIWAKRNSNVSGYCFNYENMKLLNDDKQMTSVWQMPICSGKERLKLNGKTLHPTQKPLALLYRIILSCSKEGDVILDPFFGTGTSGVVAKLLKRIFIGIELNTTYSEYAQERLNNTLSLPNILLGKSKLKPPRVSLGNLIENNLIKVGDILFNNDYECKAEVCANGSLLYNNNYYSMNQLAQEITQEKINAWNFWFINKNSCYIVLNKVREDYIKTLVFLR